ncbi:hypothetical protein lerEdw1_010404 [Lerista edwardsae]|nr:hypothetical protein lerEdw1_010404 [Lerista edwardsae]
MGIYGLWDRLQDILMFLSCLVSTEEVQIAIPIMKPTLDKVQLAGQTLPPGFPAPFLFADGLSSVETLLTNIQGLLKVAVDNARVQEKQIQQEKKELKMELCRERELRESLERQLTAELQSRATIQKRLKKEKKAKRKLQEALEFESKRREQVEQALKQATSGDGLRMLNGNILGCYAGIPDMEVEHNGTQHDSATMQDLLSATDIILEISIIGESLALEIIDASNMVICHGNNDISV